MKCGLIQVHFDNAPITIKVYLYHQQLICHRKQEFPKTTQDCFAYILFTNKLDPNSPFLHKKRINAIFPHNQFVPGFYCFIL